MFKRYVPGDTGAYVKADNSDRDEEEKLTKARCPDPIPTQSQPQTHRPRPIHSTLPTTTDNTLSSETDMGTDVSESGAVDIVVGDE
jgi:hypothetical protein